MKLIFRYIKRHIGIFLISTAFLTMEALADLLQPTFMSYIVDNGVKNADLQAIGRYGLIMLGIAITGALCAMARNYFASITSQTIGKELRHDMYENVQSLSLENIDRLKPASIITRLTNDVTQIQDFINGLMRMMVKAPITCIGAITLIIIQTPRQAPIIGVILVIAGILIFCNIRIGYPKFGNVQRKLDKLNGVSREFLSSVRVVKAFRAEDEETVKFGNASGELAGANVSALRVMAVFTPFISLTVNFGIVLLLWISGSADASHIGRLMASVNYMSQVLFALNMISFVINNAVRALASSERISEVLDEKPAQKPAGTATLPSTPDTGHILSESNAQKPEIHGEITFDHVSFGYSGSHRDTLKDLTFTIPAGKTVGIIGPTGSGKTTLVNLVPRFYDVTGGVLYIDGVNVNDIDEKHLRNSIAVVPQKALLFTGTIADNLRFGRKDASLEELKEAARIACASEFIEKTKDGYDSILGQGGVNLSGGQKQRLSLCRALIRKPRILILDDCTSALDSKTEAQVLSGLRALTETPTSCNPDTPGSSVSDASGSSAPSSLGGENAAPMTVLLISQRISTVRKADMILCLSSGEMKGFGSHDELMASCKEYRAIYESQIGGSETSSLAQNGGEIDGQ